MALGCAGRIAQRPLAHRPAQRRRDRCAGGALLHPLLRLRQCEGLGGLPRVERVGGHLLGDGARRPGGEVLAP
eukprot:5488715-Alexandrium_andersonii.AAC.1